MDVNSGAPCKHIMQKHANYIAVPSSHEFIFPITRTDDVYERLFFFGIQLTEKPLQNVDNLSR